MVRLDPLTAQSIGHKTNHVDRKRVFCHCEQDHPQAVDRQSTVHAQNVQWRRSKLHAQADKSELPPSGPSTHSCFRPCLAPGTSRSSSQSPLPRTGDRGESLRWHTGSARVSSHPIPFVEKSVVSGRREPESQHWHHAAPYVRSGRDRRWAASQQALHDFTGNCIAPTHNVQRQVLVLTSSSTTAQLVQTSFTDCLACSTSSATDGALGHAERSVFTAWTVMVELSHNQCKGVRPICG